MVRIVLELSQNNGRCSLIRCPNKWKSADTRKFNGSSGRSKSSEYKSMFDFIRKIKSDLTAQNETVSETFVKVNTKIDTISKSVQALRTDNEALKKLK